MTHSRRADWFYRAKWGLFMHFLAQAPGGNGDHWGGMDAEEWNRRVDAFDVEKLAAQLHELNAGYFFLTIGQNTGFYCSPNATYDRLTGRSDGFSRCSRRDLVADMYRALEPYGIPLLVYLPTHAPMHDLDATVALRCIPSWNFDQWSPRDRQAMAGHVDPDSRLMTFQRHWEAIVREWSRRWGKHVHGWWFDGCYYAERLYAFSDEPNFTSFAASIRSGNQDSMVCWNPGVVYPPRTISSEEDYTSGENDEPERTVCLGRWVKQAQMHVLSFLGKSWGGAPLRYQAEEMLAVTRRIVDAGGVFTWDVPFDHSDGTIHPEVMAVLRRFSDGMAADRPGTVPAVPLVEFSLTTPVEEQLDGAFQTGMAELRLSNPQDRPLSGTLEMRLEPQEAFRQLRPLDFSLQPEEEIVHRVKLESDRVSDELFFGVLRIKCHGIDQSFDFPCRHRVMALERTRIFSIREPRGDLLAEIGLTVKGAMLYLSGMIPEPCPRPQVVPWRGSGVELFMMPGDDFSRMVQLFLTPGGEGLPALIQRSAGKNLYAGVPGAEMAAIQAGEGYRIEAAIPLALIGTPDVFGLEIQLTVSRDAGYGRKTLFGSRNPFASPEFYVRFRSGPDS